MRIGSTTVAAVVAAAVVLTLGWSTASAQTTPYIDRDSALRFQVTPENAQIFLDGYFVGTVDNYDGMFQRLHVVPGEHDLELYLEGYRSVKQHVFIQPGSTFRIRYMMEALKPGDTQDPRPVAPPRPPQPSPAAQSPAPPQPGTRSEFGSVAIRVQPRDAEVFIDGQRWEAPVDNERLVVQLPAGAHRVEIRKDGFGNYSSTIDIRRGNETTLNVSLTRE